MYQQVNTLWGGSTSGSKDWKKIIEVLEHLRQLDPSVEANNSFRSSSYKQKLYVAYLSYARALENTGDKEGAAIQYAIALKLKSSGAEASIALTRLPPIPK